MKLHLRSIIPSPKELLLCGLLALLLTLIGNTFHIFNHYISDWLGLAGHNDARALAYAVTSHIDAYKPSATIVIFIFWSLIGLLCIALFQGLQHTTRRILYLQHLGSRRHRHKHPQAVIAFCKQWALTSVSSFLALGSAVFILCLVLLCLLPLGIVYTRVFLAGPTVFGTFFGLMGVSLQTIGLLLLFVAIRLVSNRRRLIRLT